MPFNQLSVGIVAPSEEIRAALRSQLSDAGIGARVCESVHYCSSRNDSSTRRLVSAGVDVVLVDMEDSISGLQTLRGLTGRGSRRLAIRSDRQG